MKIFSTLFAILTLIVFSATQTFAQTKIQTVGNLTVKIGSEIILGTPVNNKIPLRRGGAYRIETSHSGEILQISTSAISNEQDEAVLTIDIAIQSGTKKNYHRTERIKIKRGEKKTFNLRIKSDLMPHRSYLTTVFYESEEATNGQRTTDN